MGDFFCLPPCWDVFGSWGVGLWAYRGVEWKLQVAGSSVYGSPRQGLKWQRFPKRLSSSKAEKREFEKSYANGVRAK